MQHIKLPEISLVLLIGPSSSGKTTFARQHFSETEVISSDRCRALVSDEENNLDATADAFDLLFYMAAKRLKRGKLTVVDALNIRAEDRARLVKMAKENYALAVAIVLENPIRTLFQRHEQRTDRHFTKGVLEKQFDDCKYSLKTIKREGFSYVYFIKPEEAVEIRRTQLWNNKKEETGPFDIIGDIHGCFDELELLMYKMGYHIDLQIDGHYRVACPEGRRIVFVGDLTDRGPKSPAVLRLVMDMVEARQAFCVRGNHDDKLQRYLSGKNVKLKHGLELTAQQLLTCSAGFREEVRDFLDKLVSHYVFDGGKLVVAHAGLPEAMQGRASGAVSSFCMYGETNGEIDEFGLPVRYNWAKDYRGKAMVVYGHTPIPKTEWLNLTIDIDTGCVFGGSLTALRYPEKQLVSVPCIEQYCVPARPIAFTDENETNAQQLDDELLEIDIVDGKYIVETRFQPKVIVREANAAAALELMSRFALHPKWLIYLPPTMSPPETAAAPEFLEHPDEVFKHYEKYGVERLICEEKHMGSRAVAIVCQRPEVAVQRFGLLQGASGVIYTRTGRRFFHKIEEEEAFLSQIHTALTASGFWEEFNTDWVCLDGELLPWSAKAKDLLQKQYASTGNAATMAFDAALEVLKLAKTRGLETEELISAFEERQEAVEKYKTAYGQYCRPTEGIEGLVYAPFHLLATEGQTYFERSHLWHIESLAKIAAANPAYLMPTHYFEVDLNDYDSRRAAVAWWLQLTEAGGEGMVVKPIDFLARYKERLIQPAMKCRGKEYLRIIYGPEYDLGSNLSELKNRNVKQKRALAMQEFSLGLEALSRFVALEPLRRVHECVFGVLALESEAVDSRL